MAKDGPGGEKTEKPTPQRLKKARKRYKKAKKVNLAALKTSADQACASAKVKPY